MSDSILFVLSAETGDVCLPVVGWRLQRARGVSTTLKEWHDTAHCEHYRVHKEEYREELVAFLKSLTV